jgi:hypothetical protein
MPYGYVGLETRLVLIWQLNTSCGLLVVHILRPLIAA